MLQSQPKTLGRLTVKTQRLLPSTPKQEKVIPASPA
jgi:hypothetical protein